jgi:hypothetical protein
VAQEKAQELNRALEQQNADLTLAKALIEAQTQKIVIAAKMSPLRRDGKRNGARD